MSKHETVTVTGGVLYSAAKEYLDSNYARVDRMTKEFENAKHARRVELSGTVMKYWQDKPGLGAKILRRICSDFSAGRVLVTREVSWSEACRTVENECKSFISGGSFLMPNSGELLTMRRRIERANEMAKIAAEILATVTASELHSLKVGSERHTILCEGVREINRKAKEATDAAIAQAQAEKFGGAVIN